MAATAIALAALPYVFAYFAAEFFSTLGTTLAIGGKAGLTDKEGNLPNIQRPFLVDAGGLEQLGPRQAQLRAAGGESLGARHAVVGQHDARHLGTDGGQLGRLEAAVDRVEVLADDLQREVVLTLRGEHVAQARDVVGRELAVAGGRALR